MGRVGRVAEGRCHFEAGGVREEEEAGPACVVVRSAEDLVGCKQSSSQGGYLATREL